MVPRTSGELHAALKEVFELAGYRRYKMSKFEEYDLYAKNKDFLVSENVLTFTDLDGRLMALKPDVTLSIVKNCRESEGVEKVYYHENVYRASEKNLGFREISQAGLECVGDVDEYCVCEVLSLAAKSLLSVGRPCELDVSHLGLLCELFDACGLSPEGRSAAVRLIGEKNPSGLKALLESENTEPLLAEKLISLSLIDDEADEAAKKLRELLKDAVRRENLDLFAETCSFLSEEFGCTVRVDFSTVGDLSYYSGIVFKGYVDGVPSSVLSGGQYNGLMKKMRKSSRAIGFAVYLDLLEPLFETQNSFDADILLIYPPEAAPREIYSAAKKLSAGGKSVLTMKNEPRGMMFREIYKLSAGGEAVREK